MALISDVIPEKGHRLLVKLANGQFVILDFTGKLDTCRFCRLSDEESFFDVKTDGVFVMWGNGDVRLSASEIYTMFQKAVAV